ncbi:chromate transporter [Mycoplasmopsis adleri]|uniref:chromate transporter n=1 Tax=Mycoplasmopsis adleri TaxID=51362 RepID=UPI00387345B9
MFFLLALTVIGLLIFISLSVFGGGQIFIPIFQWFWSLLNRVFHTNISFDTMNNLFAISNSTPGVFSTKLAFATGYLVSEGQWWGFLFSFLTYFVFIIVPILIMYGAMRLIAKKQNTKYFISLMKVMNPVIAGIIGALVIQLFIGLMFPQIIFNFSAKEYILSRHTSEKAIFFDDKRKVILALYIPFAITLSTILYKYKVSVLWIILINLTLGMISFYPWT